MLAVSGILKKNNKVLFCKRISSVKYPFYWELPTFEFIENLSIEENLEQGFFERLNINVNVKKKIISENSQKVRLLIYEVEKKDGKLSLTGYGSSRFFSIKDVHHHQILPHHVRFIKKIFSFSQENEIF